MTGLQKYELEQQERRRREQEAQIALALPSLKIKDRSAIVGTLRALAEERNDIAQALASFHMQDMTAECLGHAAGDAARMDEIDDFLSEMENWFENVDICYEIEKDSPYTESYETVHVWLRDEDVDEAVKVI